ncbi:MAG: hypothetical protein J3R72DRAFT_443894 [Linnemannia gamsii]|nr:MAG: hypothetical protein J3R72DRAFT_443894 [Linnemannia gamsii]
MVGVRGTLLLCCCWGSMVVGGLLLLLLVSSHAIWQEWGDGLCLTRNAFTWKWLMGNGAVTVVAGLWGRAVRTRHACRVVVVVVVVVVCVAHVVVGLSAHSRLVPRERTYGILRRHCRDCVGLHEILLVFVLLRRGVGGSMAGSVVVDAAWNARLFCSFSGSVYQ